MGTVTDKAWYHLPNTTNPDGLVARSEQSMLHEGNAARRIQLRRVQDQDSYSLEKIALDSRVLIVEGISGSGKDTLQADLKKILKGRDVYDYSEGDVLQSWSQLQIKGIFKLQVRFMKVFVNYIEDILSQDENAVFLLNRFHLSVYVMSVLRKPILVREYDEIISSLRTLRVHVFILQLDESEIEKRSLHPERSGPWQKFQHQIVKKEGFRDRLERYLWQQRLMLDAAERQQIPYSILKSSSAPVIGGGWVRVAQARNTIAVECG